MDSILQAGIVSAPLQVILDKLATWTTQETSNFLEVDDQVRKLQRSLERTRAIAARVEEDVSPQSGDEARRLWLRDTDALLYSADDLLDEISLDLARLSEDHRGGGGGQNEVRDMLLSSFKLTVPQEVSKIRQDLDDVAKEMEALYAIGPIRGPKKISRPRHSPATSSLLAARGSLVGRDNEMNEIVQILSLDDATGPNVSVVPIVGMGGIGKTSLAQAVYNDPGCGSFDLKMWAYVSIDFDPARILRSLMESALGTLIQLSSLNALQVKLSDLLKGKRFLVVLDNYWSEDDSNWDVLLSSLVVGGDKCGSKVLVTTRSTRVAGIVGSVPPYILGGMSDETCWDIIRERAFLGHNAMAISTRLEELGRALARRCGGSPLGAQAVGDMLRFEDGPTRWESILISPIWDEAESVFTALVVSYIHLPPHLRKCFSYCSVFPENHEFEASELVLMWMAEGFIQPCGNTRSEDIGAHYFDDLLSRSFFEFSHKREGQNFYKMHDLIHGLALAVSRRSCLVHRVENCVLSRNTRHLSLQCEGEMAWAVILAGSHWYGNLHTFRVIFRGINSGARVPYNLFLKMKLLRVLDLSSSGLDKDDKLLNSIAYLRHLRYLDLSDNRFKKLPESIGDLLSLQTLKLDQCFLLRKLPSSTKNMVNLRHLDLNTKQLGQMPPELGKLINLQGLSAFIVGRDQGRRIGELGNLQFLRGSFCIKNLENVRSVAEAQEARMHEKPFLDELELEWAKPEPNHGEILAGLRPHEHLKKLTLTNYAGFLLPGWFGNRYDELTRVHLRSCRQPQILVPLERLRNLKSLVVEGMSEWTHVGREFLGFPCLEYLVIMDVPNLTRWEVDTWSHFSCLRELSIENCPELANLPSLANRDGLEELSISRCPKIDSLSGDGLPGSLRALTISKCDRIRDRCRVVEGQDWWMIREIPKIVIDYVEITMEMRRF